MRVNLAAASLRYLNATGNQLIRCNHKTTTLQSSTASSLHVLQTDPLAVWLEDGRGSSTVAGCFCAQSKTRWNKEKEFGGFAMKHLDAGAHFLTPWLLEPAKHPDDRADCKLGCSSLPYWKHKVPFMANTWYQFLQLCEPDPRSKSRSRDSEIHDMWPYAKSIGFDFISFNNAVHDGHLAGRKWWPKLIRL